MASGVVSSPVEGELYYLSFVVTVSLGSESGRFGYWLLYCPEKNWYVLRVRSQSERLAQVGLHNKQFEILNPICQSLSVRKDRRKS